MLDHRGGMEVPEDIIRQAGLPVGAGRGLFEAPNFTCKHCHRVIVMNPQRETQRNYCKGCDHLICDGCAAIKAATKQCRTFDQLVDELQSKYSSGG